MRVLIFSLVLQCSAAFASVQFPKPEMTVLPNGLKIVWFAKDSIPVLDMSLIVHAGYRDDAPGKSGTAELLSHTLDRGAGGKTAQQVAYSIEKLGASKALAVGDDDFTVGLHGLSTDGEDLLNVMNLIITQPDFPELEVKNERSRILERWSHLEDYTEALASLAYRRWISSGTIYGRGDILSTAEFKKIQRADLVQFHKKYFTPKNSVFIVVGRVSEPFKAKALSVLGEWKGETPTRNWKKYSDKRFESKHNSVILIDRPGATQAQVRLGFQVPLIQSPDHDALTVANSLLGEYFNSRLNSLLRDKLGLTYAINSSISYSSEFADFGIVSATQNENVGQLLRRTVDVLKNFQKGPVTPEEVETAKGYLVGGIPVAHPTLHAVAARWLVGYLFGLGENYLNEIIPKIEAVTAEQVQAAAKKHFNLNHLVIVVSGDVKKMEKNLKEYDWKAFKKVGLKDL